MDDEHYDNRAYDSFDDWDDNSMRGPDDDYADVLDWPIEELDGSVGEAGG